MEMLMPFDRRPIFYRVSDLVQNGVQGSNTCVDRVWMQRYGKSMRLIPAAVSEVLVVVMVKSLAVDQGMGQQVALWVEPDTYQTGQ